VANSSINVKEVLKSKRFYEVVFVAAVLASFVAWLCGIFLHGEASSQINLFFGRLGDFLADTLNVVGYSSERDVYHNMMYTGLEEKAYPPLTYVMMYFFSRLVDMSKYYEQNYFLNMYTEPLLLIMYMIYATVIAVMFYEIVRTCKNGSNAVKIWTAAAVMVSMPVIYSYERANTIILTTFCVMFYIFYYDSENRIMREIALICLAVATAFKMTPAVLGILLLYNRQWKEAVRAVIYGVIVVVLPFLFFEGGFSNIAQMFTNMQANVGNYTSADGATLYAAVLSFGAQASDSLETAMKYVTYAVCLFLLIVALFYRKRWMRIAAVCIVLIILPSHSGYYCIMYFIPAIVAFLNEEEHSLSELLILFASLLIMYDIQSTTGDNFLNYHLALVIVTVYLVVMGIVTLVKGELWKKTN
jgi:hypothetical protein